MTATNTNARAQAPAPDQGIDYYKLLGVPCTASAREITRAYREAMRRAHPDRQRPEARAAAEERAKLINRAFTTLSKADARRAYDATIKAEAVQEQIMNRYFGGMGMPGSGADPFAESLRRAETPAEKADRVRTDRTAITTIFAVFGGAMLAVIVMILLLALASSLFDAIVSLV